MIRTYSQTESARRDTIHTKADGYALDRISNLFYGVSRPANFPLDTWANVLTAWAYAPRCTIQGTWSVIDAMFRPYANLLRLNGVQITEISNNDQVMLASQVNFSDAHAQRLALIVDGDSETLVFMPSAGTGYAHISRVDSGHWSGYSTTGTVSVIPLPYWLEERKGEIILWLDGELMSAPPTYIQENSNVASPAGQPLGGILLNLFDLDPATLDYGDQTDGPFPLYLSGEDLGGLFGHLLKRTIPAGVRLSVRAHQWAGTLGTGVLGSIPNTGSIGQP